jgi:hypothetical protein
MQTFSFYSVALSFYPALLALVAPLGLFLLNGDMMLSRGGAKLPAPDSDTELKAALSPVVGLAALITLMGLLLHLGAPAVALLPTAVSLNVFAVYWLWRIRAKLPSFRLGASLFLIGLIAYLLLIAPLLVAGRFAVLGYNANNDPVFHNIIAEYIDLNGYSFPDQREDGFTQAAYDKLVSQGYPDGWHQTLLLAGRLFGRRAFDLFNFTQAFFMSLTALVSYAWLRRAGVSVNWGLFGGLASAVGYIQLSYAFQGFAPQVAVTPFIYGSLFFVYRAVVEARRAMVLFAALLLQGALAIYSFTVLIWLAVFLSAIAFLKSNWRTGIDFSALKGVVGVGCLILALALISNPFTAMRLGAALNMAASWSAADGLGNLISARVPILPIAGIWPAGDHRIEPAATGLWLSYAATGVILAIAAFGLWAKPGRPLLMAGAAAMAVPMVLLKLADSPYYFAKTLQLAAPMLTIGLTAGLYFLARSGASTGAPAGLTANRRRLAIALAALYLVGMAFSNLVVIKISALTPAEPFAELQAINDRFGGFEGPVLFVDDGEDWGKYLLSDLKVVSPLARSYHGMGPGMSPISDFRSEDAKTLDSAFSEFDLIVIRVDQARKASPWAFDAAFRGRFYNVYVKKKTYVKELGELGDVVSFVGNNVPNGPMEERFWFVKDFSYFTGHRSGARGLGGRAGHSLLADQP